MIVGLTGGIGSGKSTVAKLFADRGAQIIDTDVIAREVVEPPSPLLDRIAVEFGKDVIGPDGRLDRSALALIVFKDAGKLRRLNDILHPAILKRTLADIPKHAPTAVTVVVVPLLFESGFEKNCDTVVAVVTPAEVRRRRAMERGFSPEDFDARMRSQLADEDYARRARIVIHNDGDLQALTREVDKAWSEIISGRP
jgi:dephospho-CoA kinase